MTSVEADGGMTKQVCKTITTLYSWLFIKDSEDVKGNISIE